jgi:hypothetical protein
METKKYFCFKIKTPTGFYRRSIESKNFKLAVMEICLLLSIEETQIIEIQQK